MKVPVDIFVSTEEVSTKSLSIVTDVPAEIRKKDDVLGTNIIGTLTEKNLINHNHVAEIKDNAINIDNAVGETSKKSVVLTKKTVKTLVTTETQTDYVEQTDSLPTPRRSEERNENNDHSVPLVTNAPGCTPVLPLTMLVIGDDHLHRDDGVGSESPRPSETNACSSKDDANALDVTTTVNSPDSCR